MLALRPGDGELIAQSVNGQHYADEILPGDQRKSVHIFTGPLKLLDVLTCNARQGNQQRVSSEQIRQQENALFFRYINKMPDAWTAGHAECALVALL